MSVLRLRMLATLLTAMPVVALAQTGGVRIGTAGTPDASAVLDLSPDPAAPKGLLPPRLTQTQRDAIGAPAAGLTIFNTTTGQLNVWSGTRWQAYLSDTSDQAPVTFVYTGTAQTYTVPAGVTQLQVDLAGAAGGSSSADGGRGGRTQTTLPVTPGEVLTVVVGGVPRVSKFGPSGGFNGGGAAAAYTNGGGGATDIRRGGTTAANRVLVAGGGGGSGPSSDGGGGGGGFGDDGQRIASAYPGRGGTQIGPGQGGSTGTTPPVNGSPGVGEKGGDSPQGGAGGGGYFGGGGGGGQAGGGGGSGYSPPGVPRTFTTGYQAGDGYARLVPVLAGSPAPVLDASNFLNVPGDNLGSHTATQNLSLGPYQLVGNGGSTGLSVSQSGRVGIGAAAPNSGLQIASSLSVHFRSLVQTAGAYQNITLTDADYTVRSGSPAGVSGGPVFSFFLPSPTGRTGRVYVLLNSGNTPANLYTSTTANGFDQTLVYDDATGYVPQVPARARLMLQSDGSTWLVIGR